MPVFLSLVSELDVTLLDDGASKSTSKLDGNNSLPAKRAISMRVPQGRDTRVLVETVRLECGRKNPSVSNHK